MKPLAFDSASARELYAMRLTELASIDVAAESFVCLLAEDWTKVTLERQYELARDLVTRNPAYVCVWGAGSAGMHDVVDSSLEDAGLTEVITTWHEDETLADALFYFLRQTHPTEKYYDQCRAAIVLAGDDPRVWSEVVGVLSNPGAFVDRVSANP